jgi:catalase
MSEDKYYTLAEGQHFGVGGGISNPTHTDSRTGCPFASNNTAVLMRNRSGTGGLGLLQDTQLIETLAHFNRERIPERYEQVHLLYNTDFN